MSTNGNKPTPGPAANAAKQETLGTQAPAPQAEEVKDTSVAGAEVKDLAAGEQQGQQETGDATAADLRAQLELIARNAWNQLTGRDDLTMEAFAIESDSLILDEVVKIEGHGDLVPRTYFTEAATATGYQCNVEIGEFTFNSTDLFGSVDPAPAAAADEGAVAQQDETKDPEAAKDETKDPSDIDPPADTDPAAPGAGVIDEMASLTQITEKAFHYAGITDSLDDYIAIMNGNKILYTVGANQQMRLLSIFKSLLSVPDSLFEKVIEAVLVRFRDNIAEGKCFNEYKRGLYLIDPKSTDKNPSATIKNKADYDYFNNMMALLSAFSCVGSRKEVVRSFNVERVFKPIQSNRVYTHGIERFIDYLKR